MLYYYKVVLIRISRKSISGMPKVMLTGFDAADKAKYEKVIYF